MENHVNNYSTCIKENDTADAPLSPSPSSQQSVSVALGNSISTFGSWLTTSPTPNNPKKSVLSSSSSHSSTRQKFDVWDRNDNLRCRLDDESEIGCYYDGSTKKWYSWGRKPI